MQKSKNKEVKEFLNDIKMFDDEKFNTLQKLREIVFDVYQKATERIMYGGIMLSGENDFGGLFVRKNHISFEFSKGFAVNDPKKILEGTGKFRRHLKIRSLADVRVEEVEFFVKQVV